MARRTFSISSAREQAGDSIVDVPSLLILRVKPLREIIDAFEKTWGTRPTTVALPAVDPSGLLVSVEGLTAPRSELAQLSVDTPDFASLVSSITAEGLDVILTMRPDLSFLGVDSLKMSNIIGAASTQICIGNPRAREVAAAILGSSVDVALEASTNNSGRVRGVAVDSSEIWPMSGSGNRILPHCFCKSCQSYFDSVTPGLVAKFRTFPNPMSLCLRAREGEGINFISEFGPRASPEEIVGLARQQQFDQAFLGSTENQLADIAGDMLQYVRARHDQTVSSLHDLLIQATTGLTDSLDLILIAEGEQFGWTSGIFIEDLDAPPGSDSNPFDEIWFNPTNEVPGLPRARYRSYMWGRSRYYVGDLFDLAASLASPQARLMTGLSAYRMSEARHVLALRAARTGARSVGGEALVALRAPSSSESRSSVGRVGLVGVALDSGILDQVARRAKIAPGPRDNFPSADMGQQHGDDGGAPQLGELGL